MADNPLLPDNSLAGTQRTIQATTGVLTFANSGTDNSFSIGPGDSDDYYRLTVSRSSNVIVKLQPQGSDLSLSVLDAAGNPIGQTNNNPSSLVDAVVSNPTAPLQSGQTYYIRVFGTSTTDINYSLTVETSPTSRSDIVWQNIVNPGANGIWRMNGTQAVGFDFTTPLDPIWRLAGVGDFNGDNAADYLWHEPNSGQLYIWLIDGTGTTVTEGISLGIVGGNWYVGGVGDFSGDGRNDILWADANTGFAGVWVMNGTTPTRFDTVDYIPDPNWVISAVADFNGDNKTDIFYRNSITGENSIWLMNGTAFFESSNNLPPVLPASWSMEATADFDSDGDQDLLWHDRGTGLIYAWIMNRTDLVGGAEIGVVDPATYRIAGTLNSAFPVDLAGNTLTTAFNIGKLDATATYNDVIGSSDIQDLYAFTLDFGSRIGITATGTGISNLANFDILSANGTVIASATTTGVDEKKLTNLVLEAGTYYVRASALGATNANYGLSIVLEERLGSNLLFPPSPTVIFKRVDGTVIAPNTTVSVTNPFPFDLEYTTTYVGSSLSQFEVGFFLSVDGVLDASDYRFDLNGDSVGNGADVATITGALPGTPITRTQRLVLPRFDDPFWNNRGTTDVYNIIIVLDPENKIPEVDPVTRNPAETDNALAAPIRIERFRPDLLPENLIVTPRGGPVRGGTIDISGLVRNIGTARSDAGRPAGSTFEVGFYLSRDTIFNLNAVNPGDRDIRLNTTPVTNSFAPLSVGQQIGLPTGLNAILPQNWAGYSNQQPNNTYYVLMVVDPGGTLNEVTGGVQNNTLSLPIVIL